MKHDSTSSQASNPQECLNRNLSDNEIVIKGSQSSLVQAANGNFRNYYAIRKDVREANQRNDDDNEPSDRRVQAMITWINSHKMIEGILCRTTERYLDIGCNSGQNTFQFANHLKDQPKQVIGIDIDEELVCQAIMNAERYGYQSKSEEKASKALGSGRVGYSTNQPRKRIRIEEPDGNFVATILACDWALKNGTTETRAELDRQIEQGFDLITALSVTKWVQLAHADFGIRIFFARISTSLRRGGLFVLEPQPFKSYKGLHKLTKPESQERQNIAEMKIYPEDFPWILTVEFGLIGPFFIRQRGKDGFMRDLQAYMQPTTLDTACLVHRDRLLERISSDYSIPWVQRDRQRCV